MKILLGFKLRGFWYLLFFVLLKGSYQKYFFSHFYRNDQYYPIYLLSLFSLRPNFE